VTRSVALLLVGSLAMLAGCLGPEPSVPAASAQPEAVAEQIRYSCGGAEFDAAILSAPGIAESGTDELAVALRAALAPGGLPDAIDLPAAGWHRIGLDNMTAEFLTFDRGRPVYIRFRRTAGGGWEVTGWGECRPAIVLPDGLGVATWVPDPAQPAPGPETTSFTALVTERACASGRSAEGRIVGPRVLALEDRVLVVFAVQPLGGDQECPGNPSTPVTVDLGEPLGGRELVDPSVLFTED
jgi:hypothetical protein